MKLMRRRYIAEIFDLRREKDLRWDEEDDPPHCKIS